MKIWSFGPCFYTQTFLIIIYVFPSELGSKDLNNYKNYKAYTKHYHKSGWLQPLLYHNLTCSNCCILKGEYRKSQSVNDLFHKLWIILERSAKIRSWHCTCMEGMGEMRNHVAAVIFRLEAAVRTGLTNPSCTKSANEWLPCREDIEPTKIKGALMQIWKSTDIFAFT